MKKYYVVYKPDSTKNFFFVDERSNKKDRDGKVLDHIMQLPDGDLGNYEIYEHIIGEPTIVNDIPEKSLLYLLAGSSHHLALVESLLNSNPPIYFAGGINSGRSFLYDLPDYLKKSRGFSIPPENIIKRPDFPTISDYYKNEFSFEFPLESNANLEDNYNKFLIDNPKKKQKGNNRKHSKRRK